MLDMNKHATLMYNALIHNYRDDSFMQTDRDASGIDTFKSIEKFFDINNQFVEFGTTLGEYMIDLDYLSAQYSSLGAKSNCDIAYRNFYIFNPLQMAGVAIQKKNINLSTRNIPIWTYKYSAEKKKLIGFAFNENCLERENEVELNSTEKSRLEKGREYYNKAIEKFGDLNSTDIYKTLPNYETAENIYEGELKDNRDSGKYDYYNITAYYNSIRVANGYEPVTKDEQGISIAQHMTTLLSYIRKWLKPSP